MTAVVQDPEDNQNHFFDFDITVTEPSKRFPSFLPGPQEPIRLQEDFSDFDSSIIELQAVSNIDDNPNLIFKLVPGRAQQTNKDTFRYKKR